MKYRLRQIGAAMALGLAASSSQAAVLSAFDSIFGVIDNDSSTRIYTIGPGSPIVDVRIKIDFAKCGGTEAMQLPAVPATQEPCPNPSAEEYANEIYLALESPDGIVLTVLADSSVATTPGTGTYDWSPSTGGRYQVNFTDSAANAAGPALATGDFRPAEALSGFNGLNPEGTWTLTIQDTESGAPLSYFSSFLMITTADVPEPSPLALLGLGALALGAFRRRTGELAKGAR